jgi:hypothetical protein
MSNDIKLKKGEALVLRTCNADMTAHGGFKWPSKGKVKAPDWSPSKECGNGLHGLLWGEGDGSLMSYDEKAVWMVCKVKLSDCVDLGRKVKFPSCEVVYAGTRENATQLIALANPRAVVEGLIATGGYSAKMTGGYSAKMTGGDFATMTGGNYATMTGGYSATMTGGNFATMTGGYSATMTGGDYATMTGGYSATMTGGDYATMTGGDFAKMTGGYSATMTGGYSAVLQFSYWDGKRTRVVIAYVGEDGIKPNKPYRLDENHKPKEVTE